MAENYCIGSLARLRERAEMLRDEKPERHVPMFEDMMTDFIAGVAHGVDDDPQTMARELLTLGGEVYGDMEMWVTWPAPAPGPGGPGEATDDEDR